MTDHVYEMGVVWQNIAYNMPPHLSYFLPDWVAANQPEDHTTTTEYNFVGIAPSKIVQTTWGSEVTVGGQTLKLIGAEGKDFDNRFAGETNAKDDTWRFRDASATYQGLWAQGGNVKLAVLNVKNGDELTFDICKGGQLTFDNPAQVGGTSAISEGISPLSISADGHLLMTAGAGTYIRSITIRSNSEATGIVETTVHERLRTADSAYYTLSGQRVTTPTKGIYIHQGKKIIIK